METPFEYHIGKLGVKIAYLTSDKNCHINSIRVIKYRALKNRIDSIANPLQHLRKPSANNTSLVDFNSMDQTWKDILIQKFGEPHTDSSYKCYFASQFSYDSNAFKFFSQKYQETTGGLSLEFDYIAEYTANASVLNTVEIVKTKRTAYRKSLQSSCRDIWVTLSIEVNDFKEVPHTLPTSPDGLRKKYDNYKKNGYLALVSKKHHNMNARKMIESQMKLLNDLFAGQDYKPTAMDVSRQYSAFLNGTLEIFSAETGEEYFPSQFKPLTDRHIRRFLSNWENRIGNHMIRSGDRQKYMAKYKPHHETIIPTFAGSLLSIDDRQPPFHYEGKKRPWLYIGVDLASGCITAFVHGKSKDGIILDFYRQLVRNYTDWGFPMPDGLECESSLNSSFKETFLKPGAMFQNVRIEANNARGKKIERMFGTFRNERERSSEGWIARPFAKSEANQKGSKSPITIPYEDIITERLQDIEDWNNEPHHSNKEMTRWEYFNQMQYPGLEPTNWQGILPHLGYVTETSCNVGYVKLQGLNRMIAEKGEILTGDSLIAKMKRIEGKKVTVYWLDGNDGEVMKAIAYLGNEYICELMPVPKYNRAKNEQTDQDLENRLIQTKYVSTVDHFARERKKSVRKVVLFNNQKKTLNRNFVIPGISRITQPPNPDPQPAPTYGGEDDDEDTIIQNQPHTPSWHKQYQ